MLPPTFNMMDSSLKIDVCYAISLSHSPMQSSCSLVYDDDGGNNHVPQKKNCNVFVSEPSKAIAYKKSCNQYEICQSERARENVRNQELAATKKKDIKLKVVKASFKIFNLFPISFLSFSWVFFRFLTTKQSAIDSHFQECVVLFHI